MCEANPAVEALLSRPICFWPQSTRFADVPVRRCPFDNEASHCKECSKRSCFPQGLTHTCTTRLRLVSRSPLAPANCPTTRSSFLLSPAWFAECEFSVTQQLATCADPVEWRCEFMVGAEQSERDHLAHVG